MEWMAQKVYYLHALFVLCSSIRYENCQSRQMPMFYFIFHSMLFATLYYDESLLIVFCMCIVIYPSYFCRAGEGIEASIFCLKGRVLLFIRNKHLFDIRLEMYNIVFVVSVKFQVIIAW